MIHGLLRRLRSVTALVVIAAFIAIVGLATACGDDDDGDDGGDVSSQLTAIQADIDALHAEVNRSAVYTAVNAMRAQELHQLNLDVQALDSLEGDNNYETRLNRVSEAVSVSAWPADLQPAADDLTEKLDAADQAFEDGDLAAVKTNVKDVHDFWHILDADAATYLGASSNGDHANGDDHSGEDGMDGTNDSVDDEQTDDGGEHDGS